MKSKTLCSVGGPVHGLHLSPKQARRQFVSLFAYCLFVYSSFRAHLYKELLTHLLKATPHLCPEGSIDKYEAVLSFLQPSMMPRVLQSQLFFKKYDVLLLSKTVLLLCYAVILNKLFMITEGKTIWWKAEGEYLPYLRIVFKACKKAKLNHARDKTWYCIADPLPLSGMVEATAIPW